MTEPDQLQTGVPQTPSNPTAVPQESGLQDVVADLPDELAALVHEHGSLPADVELEPGFYCKWQGRYFIHTRATLPLHAIDEGIGFGLWVELEASEFERYLAAVASEELYSRFKTTGLLANNWPGFLNTFDLPVTVRTVRGSEKVYITQVQLDRMRDVLFEVALNAQTTDLQAREQILALVQAWMVELHDNQAAVESETVLAGMANAKVSELGDDQFAHPQPTEQSAEEPAAEPPLTT